jgi:hypothetical protein
MKILIIGDSFSADWSVKYNDYPGWPQLLSAHHNITNLSQAGCSEYRILKQLTSLESLEDFDIVLVSHTSPSRIYTPRHPIHCNDVLHKNSDLIYTDVEYHSSRIKNLFNRSLQSAKNFFLFHYSDDYYLYMYDKIREDIDFILKNKQVITITNLPYLTTYKPSTLDFSNLLLTHRGKINHYSLEGNEIIFNEINQCINSFI